MASQLESSTDSRSLALSFFTSLSFVKWSTATAKQLDMLMQARQAGIPRPPPTPASGPIFVLSTIGDLLIKIDITIMLGGFASSSSAAEDPESMWCSSVLDELPTAEHQPGRSRRVSGSPRVPD